MKNTIYPCLTIKDKAVEAAAFYLAIFGDGKIIQQSPFAIQFLMSNQKFLLLNDGPSSQPNAAISFMVNCKSNEEVEYYWNQLIEGGRVLMPINTYPWSTKYGWLVDQYGVSWQLFTATEGEQMQKFTPTLMFTGTKAGKAAKAIAFYTQVFPNAETGGIFTCNEGEGDRTDFIKHARFSIDDFAITAMDSSMDDPIDFNDAISFVVACDTQSEIDYYWEQLSTRGGREIACGWLQDKFGISWQIIPKKLSALIEDPERAPKVMNALMQMKKLVIADLENA
ncbi:VOC family protein [Olivibacter sp. CPCC 100613]|uniref:VOC family protein n=1 Tax=Olivibacter sp. CPCC 100613 TaxID=3079931 RepID=UPI002FF844FC